MSGAVYGHHVAGPALLAFTAAGGSQLTTVGYTEEGVDLAFEFFEKPIFGDQNGGSEGAPVDFLLLGAMLSITAEEVDYDQTAMQSLLAHRSGTWGTPETAGQLLLAGSHYIRLLINAAGNPINIPYAFLTSPAEFDLGVKQTRQKLTFKGMIAVRGGALFNATNT